MGIYILILLTALIPTFPGPGKEQSLHCAGIACECGWEMTLNRLENPQIPIFTLQDFAVGTVSLFPPYNSRRRGVCLILPPQALLISELFPSPMGEGARRAGEGLHFREKPGPGWGAA